MYRDIELNRIIDMIIIIWIELVKPVQIHTPKNDKYVNKTLFYSVIMFHNITVLLYFLIK